MADEERRLVYLWPRAERQLHGAGLDIAVRVQGIQIDLYVVTTYNQSRDHGEQRLGSYLDTRSDPNIYVRYRARRRHRDPDSSAPRFHDVGKPAVQAR